VTAPAEEEAKCAVCAGERYCPDHPDFTMPSGGVPAPPQEARDDEWLSDETVRQVAQREPLTVPVRLAREVQHHREVRAKGQGPAAAPSEPWVTTDEPQVGERVLVGGFVSFVVDDVPTDPDDRRNIEVTFPEGRGWFAATDLLRPLSGSADSSEVERLDLRAVKAELDELWDAPQQPRVYLVHPNNLPLMSGSAGTFDGEALAADHEPGLGPCPYCADTPEEGDTDDE